MVASRKFKRGDHIYTDCGLYCHHGIYVGKGKVRNPNNGKKQQIEQAVIHFIGYDNNGKKNITKPQCTKCFYKSQDVGVVLTCLDCFREGELHLYEYDVSLIRFNFRSSGSCSTLSSSEPDVVIKRAYDYYLGNQIFGDYNLFFNNCEHFATKCKTGIARCNQVSWGTGLPGALAYNIVREFGKGLFSWD